MFVIVVTKKETSKENCPILFQESGMAQKMLIEHNVGNIGHNQIQVVLKCNRILEVHFWWLGMKREIANLYTGVSFANR